MLIQSGLRNSKELQSTAGIFFIDNQGKYHRGNCDAEQCCKDGVALSNDKNLLIYQI